MNVAKLTDPNAFCELREEWLRLLARMAFQSPFLTPQWHEVWWRHFARDRQLRLFTVRSDEGVLRGLAPLMMGSSGAELGCLSFVGDLDVSDYCEVLVDPDFAEEVGAALVPALWRELGDEVSLELINLSSRSLTPGLLSQGLEAHRLSAKMLQIEACPTIDLPSDWEAYLATLRCKDRNKIRRNQRRADASAQLVVKVSCEGDQLLEDLEVFFSLHRMSKHRDKREFMTAENAAFFQDLARAFGPCGWFELALLYADGVAIAGLCCFPYGLSYAVYNAGFHPDYSHLSPGIVLIANRIRDTIDRRFTQFDFLRGDEAYKYRFGAVDRPLYKLSIESSEML